MIKSYDELCTYKTFEERLSYLMLFGIPGDYTIGDNKILSRNFYNSKQWKRVRNAVIVRDGCCIFGLKDYPISGKVIVHHINPINQYHLVHGMDVCLDLNNLITVSNDIHQHIHYGNGDFIFDEPIIDRYPGDTTLW